MRNVLYIVGFCRRLIWGSGFVFFYYFWYGFCCVRGSFGNIIGVFELFSIWLYEVELFVIKRSNLNVVLDKILDEDWRILDYVYFDCYLWDFCFDLIID